MADDPKTRYVNEPGVLDIEKMRAAGLYPSAARLARGPIAVIECAQPIPCNPCETACIKGKLKVGDNIVDLPVLDETCAGCGLCISQCPGLAIFVVDNTYGETEATVAMPYELRPYPEAGEIVEACDRRGETVCRGRILSVRCPKRNDRCAVLTVIVPKRFSDNVRHVRRLSAPKPEAEKA